ncbi:type II toxin-antitoxin system prevent-host-death family antitoxin [Microbacterium sp. NPDC097977]|uniref:type II toxin-antitoxin system Phd/YefM family antitoxin n=1 Tax=Microbacterium sp. NPDC097977 TaxID=3155686 RepID=UPI00332BE0B4
MTTIVNVQDAKTRLSELLRRVESGEEIVIARAGAPIARISAATPRRRTFETALLPEIPPISGEALFDDAPHGELADWEVGHGDDPLTSAPR